MKKDYKCKLLPYKKIDCLSIQDAKQQVGWDITAFNLPKTWEYTKGEDVVIAVLDSGCDLSHPDLIDNLIEGKNFVERGTLPIDQLGHGTHCTGILVAEENDIGMVGVCPKAKVMPVKVLDSKGNGNLLTVAEGIRWVADKGGVDFITMSLGSPNKVQQVCKAIQYAADKGIVTFCAAGNAGSTTNIFYPSNYKETISIGAIDQNFKKADFSNISPNLDFMAPGVDIFSTFPPNWYATLSGTSMACPFAVGVAALLLSYVKKGKANLELKTADDYRQIFKRHTIPVKNGNYSDPALYQGFGIIDPATILNPS